MDAKIIINEEDAMRTQGCLVPAILIGVVSLCLFCGIIYSVAEFILALINKLS